VPTVQEKQEARAINSYQHQWMHLVDG